MSISQNYPIVSPSLNLDFANTKKLDPRITFTRASEARYYDGKSVSLAEQNLLLYSQEFDNGAWGKVGTTLTTNTTTAPDGTTTADTIVANGASSSHYVSQSFTAGATQKVLSVFLKAGTNNFAQIWNSTDSNGFVNFDLSSGTVGTVGSSFTASIVSFGNGWYRCIAITSSAVANTFAIAIVTSTSAVRNETNTLATTIFAWGAQLEQRSAPTAYTVTTTQPITNYIPTLLTAPANVARFDHNPVTGESLGLEVEEQRTNLLTYSEDFANVVWIKNNSTVTANTIVAPDGTLTASKIVSGNATSATGVQQNFTATAVNHTATYFVKYAGAQFVQILSAGVSGIYANFDIINGTVIAGSYTNATITDVGNGFYRISMTGALLAGVVGTNLWLQNTGTAGRAASYTGDGYSGIYIWGASLEQGSFPTSYIKTEASQVTRAADSASMTGANFSDFFSRKEGTFYSEFSYYSLVGNRYVVSGNNPSNTVTRWIESENSNQWRVYDNIVTNIAVFTPNTFSKAAVAATQTIVAACGNGGAVNTNAAFANAPLLSSSVSLGIGNNNNGSFLNGHIKKISYYPQRLTNAQLQALTS